jgi:hypothetical protein
MKKVWEKPELEVLMVNMTMHHVQMLDHTDATFVDGTKSYDLRFS